MRKRLLAALCCIVMLLPFAASAETALVPQMSAWQLEESASPLRVTASAQMSAWVPFDDTMLEALNTLLKPHERAGGHDEPLRRNGQNGAAAGLGRGCFADPASDGKSAAAERFLPAGADADLGG